MREPIERFMIERVSCFMTRIFERELCVGDKFDFRETDYEFTELFALLYIVSCSGDCSLQLILSNVVFELCVFCV